MSCGICSKAFRFDRKPNCPSCAVATIYEARYSHALGLLQNDRVRQDVDAVTRTCLEPTDLPLDESSADLVESAKQIVVQDQRAQLAVFQSRVADIEKQQSLLRAQIEQAKTGVAARRVIHLDRKVAQRKERESLEDLLRSVDIPAAVHVESSRLQGRLVKIRDRMADGRLRLCRETAILVGLCTRRRRFKDGQAREEIIIGGLPVPDLRQINLVRPDQLSAALATVCRLLTVACHYLSLRLPAEVLPPRPGHPHPTILSVQSSYQVQDGLNQDLAQSHHMRKASQTRIQSGRSAQPKHRLLGIEKPLPLLAKDDPSAYNLFLEGITLLAYDVAWLRQAQCAHVQLDKWEDICALGQNLHQLFLGPRDSVDHFGEFSHATSWYKNLSGPEGAGHMSQTRELPSLATVNDKIKSFLLTEMSGAEWELLDEKEWTQERDDERAVLVGESSVPSSSVLSTATVGQSDSGRTTDEADKTARSERGWMKLKSRAHET